MRWGVIWKFRHASLSCCKTARRGNQHWHHVLTFLWASEVQKTMLSATPSTYTLNCLAFFVTPRRVHLDLQTILCLFFTFGFLLIFYLKLPLLLPRPQIKQLGTFFHYLSTLPAKIELFGQVSFSNLQQKLKHSMTQLRLLDHPSRSRAALTKQVYFFHKNMRSLHHQSRSYWHFPCQS